MRVLPEEEVCLRKYEPVEGRYVVRKPRRKVGDQNVPLPVFREDTTEEEFDRMAQNARDAADFLKALSHESRLMILCYLATGEKSVTQLEILLSARQAAVSQQLMRLRQEGLVQTRRDGKAIYYSLTDDRTQKIMDVVYDLFCA